MTDEPAARGGSRSSLPTTTRSSAERFGPARRQPDLEVVGEAADLSTARATVARAEPRVLILDVNLPDGLAIDAVAGLRERPPRPRSSC